MGEENSNLISSHRLSLSPRLGCFSCLSHPSFHWSEALHSQREQWHLCRAQPNREDWGSGGSGTSQLKLKKKKNTICVFLLNFTSSPHNFPNDPTQPRQPFSMWQWPLWTRNHPHGPAGVKLPFWRLGFTFQWPGPDTGRSLLIHHCRLLIAPTASLFYSYWLKLL